MWLYNNKWIWKHLLQKMFQFSLDLRDDRRTLVGQSSVELDQWRTSTDFIQGVLATGHTADSNNGYRTCNTNIPLSLVCELAMWPAAGQCSVEEHLWWGCTSLSRRRWRGLWAADRWARPLQTCDDPEASLVWTRWCWRPSSRPLPAENREETHRDMLLWVPQLQGSSLGSVYGFQFRVAVPSPLL